MSGKIILASSSPYRRELLQRLIPDFAVESPGVDESPFHGHGLSPQQLASRLAMEKAAAVAGRNPGAIVIGSDQLVELENTVLGKPGTKDVAVEQILRLSGHWHTLLTAVCVSGPGGSHSFVDETRLLMRRLDPHEARRYVERDLPLDCAGSYRIERLGIALFERIETGDFTAIMGLPLIRLATILRELGVKIP